MVVEPLTDDIEQGIGLSLLRPADQYAAAIPRIRERPRKRDDIRRQIRSAWSRNAGIRPVTTMAPCPVVRRHSPRRHQAHLRRLQEPQLLGRAAADTA